jgi:isoleucyl-tRNA synthetase
MLDFHKNEEEVLKFWEKEKIYEKVKKKNVKGKKFYFLQGPPYTSGKLHIGQAWNNSLKDMALRYRRMCGYDVWDRGGYDMHGLPTENAVQKKLGLKTKEEIEEHGVDKFIKECMKFSEEHAGYMDVDLWKMGVWLDHKNAYKPIKKEYISGEWAFFKKAWEQGRLYKGKKVMHWDAQSETSLAKHELEYKNVKDTSIFLKFKKKGTKNEYFIIWTTTPWTIPYNLAIMANPEVEYVKIKVEKEYWIMAKALVDIFMGAVIGKKFEIVEKFSGEELEGQEYEHFLSGEMPGVYEALKKEWKNVHTVILSSEYVDTSSGTGLVHCAPGCGPEDQEAGAKYGLGAFNTLNERGELENVGKYNGWTAKEDDEKFIKEFEKKGVLLATNEVEHEYPHSWRSHKPVVFRTTEQWFLKTEDLIKDLLKNDKEVNWVREKSGES